MVTVFQREHIAKEALSDFKDRWSESSKEPSLFPRLKSILSEQQNQWLDKFVLEEEIKQAVFEADPDKETGQDGFSAKFFQSCWAIIKSELIDAIKDFFCNGKMLQEVNNAHIVLIPKVANA